MVLPTGIPELSLPDIRACIPGTSTSRYWLYFTVLVIFDAFAFVLSVIPCLNNWRELKQSEIFRTLFRDGVAFFAICLAANIASIVSGTCVYSEEQQQRGKTDCQHRTFQYHSHQIYFALSGPNDNKAYLSPMACGIQAICAHRMVLNLRTVDQSCNHSSDSVFQCISKSGLVRFAEPHSGSTNFLTVTYPNPGESVPQSPDRLDLSEKGRTRRISWTRQSTALE